jgi:hypothetical protein
MHASNAIDCGCPASFGLLTAMLQQSCFCNMYVTWLSCKLLPADNHFAASLLL